MISELVPKVEALQTAKTQGPNKDINQFLRSVDLTGVLPPTSSISARKFLVRSLAFSLFSILNYILTPFSCSSWM